MTEGVGKLEISTVHTGNEKYLFNSNLTFYHVLGVFDLKIFINISLCFTAIYPAVSKLNNAFL